MNRDVIEFLVSIAAIASVAITIIVLLIKGGLKYVATRDEIVEAALANSIKEGDYQIARAVDALTEQLNAMSSAWAYRNESLEVKIDTIAHEVTHTNDGGTVKGAIVELKRAATVDELRLGKLEVEMQEVKQVLKEN